MRRMGRGALFCAVLLLTVSFFVLSVCSEEPIVTGNCGTSVTWELNLRSGRLTVSGAGAMTNYGENSPAPWHSLRENIYSVLIADNVTTVGSYAFFDCPNLLAIHLGKNVMSIGQHSFDGCREVSTVYVPPSLQLVGAYAFNTALRPPVVHITDLAAWCNINFTDVYGNPLSRKGSLYLNGELLTHAEIPEGVTRISSYAFYGYDALESVVMPNSVSAVGDYAFAFCDQLETVTFSKRLTHIGAYAFYACESLAAADLPDSLGLMEQYAFSWCSSITSVVIPNNLPFVDLGVFSHCHSLTVAIISERVQRIGYAAFNDCPNMTDLICLSEIVEYYPSSGVIDKHVTIHGYEGASAEYAQKFGLRFESIDDYIVGGFCGENVTWALCDGGVLKISGTGAMKDYSRSSEVPWHPYRKFVKKVWVEAGVTSIGSHAFEYCMKLTEVQLPDSVITIGDYAFEYCTSLLSLDLPENLRLVGDYAFSHCERLDVVTVPRGVASLGKYAFANCRFLSDVWVPRTTVTLGEGVFSDCPSLVRARVEVGNVVYRSEGNCILDVRSRTLITGLADAEIPAGGRICTIGTLAFAGRSDLLLVEIPAGVTAVEDGAFRECGALRSVTVGRDVTSIGAFAFYGCDGLESLVVLSPYAVFADAAHTVPQTTVIYGYEDSSARYYAEKYGRTFVSLGTDPDAPAAEAESDPAPEGPILPEKTPWYARLKNFFAKLWSGVFALRA